MKYRDVLKIAWSAAEFAYKLWFIAFPEAEIIRFRSMCGF